MLRLIAEGLGAKKLPTFESMIVDTSEAKAMTPEQVMEQRRRLLDKLNAR